MENNNYQGDLSDIIRSSYGSCAAADDDHWNMFFSDTAYFSSCVLDQEAREVNFGDPFSNMRDPFLQMPSSAAEISTCGGGIEEACFGGDAACVLGQQGGAVEEDQDMMRRPPCNMINLSDMINQISPISASCTHDSPRLEVKPPPAVVKDHCLLDNTPSLVRISSSPRNPPPLKRRKSQVKKSICIPAPAALNSRQSGEVVPSDLWAWRKYGQKPIKGSPYPRGYYRCSSSKGCPARKQVERSRTDPNMLVITYTSEHNHPWPTQRNALAGSSRSQPSKNNNINDNNAASENPETIDKAKPEDQERQESNSTTDDSNVSLVVKEEIYGLENKQQIDESTMVDDGEEFSDHGLVLPNYNASSKVLKCNNSQLEDLFAELGEMEGDDDQQIREYSKGLDPFHVFDWSGDNTTRSYHHHMHI